MITHLDEQVGRILSTLEQSGLADNTIVIYAADQGLAVGSHGLLGKQSVYEHSMRAPLIIRGPGVPRGKSTDALTYLLDLGPTILEVTGADAMPNVEGKTLRGIWEGKTEKVRDSIFLPYRDLMRAVTDGRWKLIRYPKIDHTQLFDLASDPSEMKDLAADPAHRAQVQRLMMLMDQWRQRINDPAPLTAEKLMKKEIDLTGHERQPDQWQPEWIRKKYFGK
jgi:arylsulfatase A-like enzyme